MGQTFAEHTEIQSLQAMAEQGDAAAQVELGYRYYEGDGVPDNPAEAVRLFRQAAEQGDARGQCALGVCYAHAIGVDGDEREAARWYRLAAEQGNVVAQLYLAACYELGTGVEANRAEAARWYLEAAGQGDGTAQYFLAQFYEQGSGDESEKQEALKWYRRAAEQGVLAAQVYLGDYYWRAKDFPESVTWYRRSIAGYPDVKGMFRLAWCYAKGCGTEADEAEAAKWYRRAAEDGEALSQYLAIGFKTGEEHVWQEALAWWRKAAEQGDAESQYHLAECYVQGLGVEADAEAAAKLLRQAAERGHEAAQEALNEPGAAE